MSHSEQKSFDLYADKRPEFLPAFRPKSSPPPRPGTKKRNVFVHYALEKSHLYPPTRKRIRPEPQQVDESRFVQSSILPYPEHPLICKLTLLPAFETEKDMGKYFDKHGMHPVTLLRWKCRACQFIHAWTTPSCMFDTNGGSCAGAETLPARILREFMHPGNTKLFRFVRPSTEKKEEPGKNPK